MSTQILTELPKIQQSGMDFATVMSEIRSIIKDNPNWAENWPEFYDSEAGVMLTELMAWVMDNMSTKQDVLVNEMFLSTAQNDENKLKLLKQIAYNPRLASAAKAELSVSFSVAPSSAVYLTSPRTEITNRTNEIAKFTSKDINGRSVPWEILQLSDGKPNYLDSVVLPAGSVEYTADRNGNSIYALQGETKYVEFTTETSDGPYFDLDDDNIAADSIQVYLKSTLQLLTEVSSFVSKDALDKTLPVPYVVETNLDRTLRIRFGGKNLMSSSRLIKAGATICVFYRTTSGSVGNISPGFINTTINVSDDAGGQYTATVTNEKLADGGADAETIDEARLNGPLTLRTMDRAVTPSDYNIILDRNANIFKARTYTATNQPDGFKAYYGRYINPQESFSYILLNKNWKDVPPSEYNNFPWITLTKEPRLNERYVFDTGNYDTSITVSPEYYNMSLVLKDTSIKNFKNAVVLNLGDTFNNALYLANGNENSFLKAKISTEETTENFFDDIKFSLLSTDKADTSEFVLTMDNPSVSADDHARFVSASSYDLSEPLDVSKGRYITVSFDGKAPVSVDLWADRSQKTDELTGDPYWPDSEYYLLWTNTGVANAKATWGDNRTKNAATYRNGIVEIINQALVQVVASTDSEFEEYNRNTSYQYFNLNQTSEIAPVVSLQDGETYNFVLKVKDGTYSFRFDSFSWTEIKTLIEAQQGAAITYPWNSTKGIAAGLGYIFSTGYGLKKLEGAAFTDIAGASPLRSLSVRSVQTLIFDTDIDNDVDEGLESVYNAYDLVIKTEDPEILSGVANYVDSEGESHRLEDVLWLDDAYMDGYMPFIHTLKGSSNYGISAHDLIKEPTQAADYENLASMVSDGENMGRFRLASPITGNSSSISFRYDPAYGTDFMKNILGLYFSNAGYSYKAYGVKRVYMLKNDALRVYITQNGVETTLDQSALAGNVIFENSCIYNSPDFSVLYSNYKIEESDALVLGSVYENFYYSGDDTVDELLKTDISGISGEYMAYDELSSGVKSYYIDENKSSYEIKFTKEIQDTNSIHAITTDIDVVGSDRIKILSAPITKSPGCPLTFSVDDFGAVTVDLQECLNGSSVVNAITAELKNFEAGSSLRENCSTIVSNSYFSLNQIQLQNLNPNDGRLVFRYPAGIDEARVKECYKTIFGTSATNNSLYTLYPKDMFPAECVVSEGDDYYYCPTEDKPLEFTYRKLVETADSEGNSSISSRAADYYITAEGTPNGDQTSYRFTLHKTENSRFPDTYFYVHFVNDRTYEFDSNGKKIETDEDILQSYMRNYKISGTDVTFTKPYFRTYDVAATITYNSNFSEAEVVSKVNSAVDELCGLEKADIAGSMSRAKILKAIMGVDGVADCKITYFGYDYSSGKGNVDTLTADFYEILCLNGTDGTAHGRIFTFEMLS